ncbi:hypothetical protein MANES_18G142800v8 [Manihot esculenta]|uniref:Uncharacterized protein n=1 Tax=Manihot esculenta TaxID=3983 RepID=A0ACB7G0V7_MANES|nr:hypothetical protein MANES_18G142800v8 [Manihot esculenta]
MAIPVLWDSIFRTYPLFHFSIRNLSNRNSIPRKNKWLCLASPQLNPVGSEVSFCVGTHLIPHPNKIERGGEDAFFVSRYNGGVIAVADGVSGWAEQNVDPSLFPQELMANASCLVGDEEVNYDPQILLGKAHAATSSIGSATVIVAMLERNGMLKIANVGDCGLRVVRRGQIIFSTSTQEHYFDCPYQLSSEMVGQTYLDAMVSNMELMEGDTIVMGSDGLFDNIFDSEIVATIARHDCVTGAGISQPSKNSFNGLKI